MSGTKSCAGKSRRSDYHSAVGSATGAYGLRIEGLEGASQLLVPVCDRSPTLRIRREVMSPRSTAEFLDDAKAELVLRDGGRILVEREPASATFETPQPLGDSTLVHPYLAPVAAVVSHWLERISFHGGAFETDGRAWALLGDREAGKSSTLAHLAVGKTRVLADDMTVIDDGEVLPGPRSVDLREEAAEQLGVGEPIGRVGARDRWRVQIDSTPAPARVPLAGFVFLEWGDDVELVRVPPADRVRRLAVHLGVRVPLRDPATLMPLAALPGFVLERPRDWGALADAAALLRSIDA